LKEKIVPDSAKNMADLCKLQELLGFQE
jgi:hypothetical protein